jgi:K+-sensing histidine kinase KdpD
MRRPHLPRTVLLRYGVAVASTVVALGVSIVLRPVFETKSYLIFFAALTLSAWFGGHGPALLTTVLTIAFVDYYFLPPVHTFASLHPLDLIAFVVFGLIGALISSLMQAEKRARADAERANAQIVRYMGIVTHEIRTPLSAIKGFASTLLAEDIAFDADQQREFLQIINSEADRLNGMVEDLLELSRIESGRLSTSMTLCSLSGIIALIKPTLGVLADNHHLVIDLPDDLPPVLADRHRIAQVLSNLVTNAAKFSRHDTEIRIQVSVIDDYLQIDVSDEGSGIPIEERETIFEPFRQGEKESQQSSRGAGLGLAICRGIVEAHGGRIWVQDTASSGATIRFTLPAAHTQALGIDQKVAAVTLKSSERVDTKVRHQGELRPTEVD